MKKKITAFLLMIVLCLSFGITALADGEKTARLADQADLLAPSAESSVLAVLDEISADGICR